MFSEGVVKAALHPRLRHLQIAERFRDDMGARHCMQHIIMLVRVFVPNTEPAAQPAHSGGAEEGGLRPDQMAKLDEASDEEMLEGGGIVLTDAAPQHVSSVSETGAKAGNHAAAAALRARLHGGV